MIKLFDLMDKETGSSIDIAMLENAESSEGWTTRRNTFNHLWSVAIESNRLEIDEDAHINDQYETNIALEKTRIHAADNGYSASNEEELTKAIKRHDKLDKEYKTWKKEKGIDIGQPKYRL